MLTPKIFSYQYSHGYKKSHPDHSKETFEYIGSEDSYVPKAFRFAYRSQYGGFSTQKINMRAAVSSVDELAKVLMQQMERYNLAMEQQKQTASQAEQAWFSSGNIVKQLNIQTDEREQLEGNMAIKMGGYKRFLTFDNSTLEALPQGNFFAFSSN